MTIKIKVGSAEKDKKDRQIEKNAPSVELQIRKTLDGNYLIKDHIDVDIIVSPEESKVIAIPKEKNFNADVVDATQNRLFEFLKDQGVIKFDTMQGGNAHFSMEAEFPSSSDKVDPLQAVIYGIAKFINDEEEFMKFDKELEKKEKEFFLEPDEELSTELGDVPQDGGKGSITQATYPFGLYYKWY